MEVQKGDEMRSRWGSWHIGSSDRRAEERTKSVVPDEEVEVPSWATGIVTRRTGDGDDKRSQKGKALEQGISRRRRTAGSGGHGHGPWGGNIRTETQRRTWTRTTWTVGSGQWAVGQA